MLLNFFTSLREAQIPVSLREYPNSLRGADCGSGEEWVEEFYFLSRVCLVKDERNLDKFDRVFGEVFKGLESGADLTQNAEIPAEWLKKLTEKFLTDEEKKEIEALGWDKLMETLKKRLEEQKGRHQGGNKWIGTGGTRPLVQMAIIPKESASARTATAIFARSRCGTSANSRTRRRRRSGAAQHEDRPEPAAKTGAYRRGRGTRS